ncbi:MAG: aminotransferase class V-fold PLP-dependent enzyme [Bacteroidota bacterium]
MLVCQKDQFQLSSSICYLNGAYMSPQPKRVEQVGLEAVQRKSTPYHFQIPDFFEPVSQLKSRFAQLINADHPKRIALIPSVSYGMANISHDLQLRKDQKIVVVAEQFPSNYYCWENCVQRCGAKLEVVALPATNTNRMEAINTAILEAIDSSTALVAIAHIHWADGLPYDLEAIGEKARAVGALLVIDGTQSVGALPFDVAKIQPDALICAGYKWLLGPYSIGVAYYGPAFDAFQPVEENWINRHESENFRNLVNYQSAYQPLAGRFSVGEQSNFILVPMLSEALKMLLEWGVPAIQAYAKNLSAPALEQLRVWGAMAEQEADRCGHLFGVRLGGAFHAEKLKAALEQHQVLVSFRGDAIRIAPNMYNTAEDFDKLLHCFEVARR